ncbi:alpha/beta fold hydrolase [Candidatus Gottesmanbacteria bacterium]|nr:alpha/beta fold hydrolase [Candidatus Gottesmanbacteria bacterium]
MLRRKAESSKTRDAGVDALVFFCLHRWRHMACGWFLAGVLSVFLSFPFFAYATSYSDDFNDGTIDSSLWRRFGDNIVSESGGTLKFYADDPPSVLTGGLSLKSALQENFDIMADLKSWDLDLNSSTPSLGAKKTNVGFEITGGNPFNPDYISLRREYPLAGTSDGIWGVFYRNEHAVGSITSYSQDPQTGNTINPEQFRLRKSGSDITASYYDKLGWHNLQPLSGAFDEGDFSRLFNNPLELRFSSQVGDMVASKVDTFTAKLDNVKIETTGIPLSLSSERPILFLPGLNETANAWTVVDSSLRQYGLTRGGVLSASWSGQNLEISGSNLTNRDYYLMNFSDTEGTSIVTQGREVRAAVQRVKDLTGAEEVILIGHSMGGLAARSYIQSGSYANDVMQLITIDTPHLGSELVFLPAIKDEPSRLTGWKHDGAWTGPEEYMDWVMTYGDTSEADFEREGIKDLSPGSLFLADLNARDHPSEIKYVSVIHEFTKYEIKPGSVDHLRSDVDKWGFANSFLGYSDDDHDMNIYDGGDGVVSLISQDMNDAGIPSTTIHGRKDMWHNSATNDFNAIMAALNVPYLSFVSFSPVDLEVVDPTGAIIDKINFGFNGIYQEFDFSDSGELEDYVLIPYPREGRYSVRVIPHLNTDPDSMFSLAVFSNEFESFLAQDMMIQDIPDLPYGFDYGPTAPVPELGSMVLFGIGAVGLLMRNRSSGRKASAPSI